MPEPDSLPVPRQELLAPYRRPYRHVLGATWRAQPGLRRATVLVVVLGAGGTIGALAASPLLWLLAGVGLMFSAFTAVGWLAAVAREARRLKRAWRRKSELGTVRERRPHAGARDPEITHDEFAVTAEDSGRLVTWRFRPLAISAHPAEHEVEIPGRPRYAAAPIADEPFDIDDAARAAEQLVVAQDRAAELEEAAADAARHGADRALEARSTAAALQRATGQRSRRD
ncbi:MAG TPA: hypothetical protein VNT55_24360 [Baekduia sp.]|nr:hypothetical protein [Baekduia sp.]